MGYMVEKSLDIEEDIDKLVRKIGEIETTLMQNETIKEKLEGGPTNIYVDTHLKSLFRSLPGFTKSQYGNQLSGRFKVYFEERGDDVVFVGDGRNGKLKIYGYFDERPDIEDEEEMDDDVNIEREDKERVTITIDTLTFEDVAGPNPRIWQAQLDEGMGRFEIVKHYPNPNYACYYYENDSYHLNEEPNWVAVGGNIDDCVKKAQKKYDAMLMADHAFEWKYGHSKEPEEVEG